MGTVRKYGILYFPRTNEPINLGRRVKSDQTIKGWCGAEMTSEQFGRMSRPVYRRGKVRRRI